MENLTQRKEPVSETKKMEGEKIAEQGTSPEVMRKYLYNFAYTTPGRPEGSGFEDVRKVFIIADSGKKALEWGKKLSDSYVKKLGKEMGEYIGEGAVWVESEEELIRSGSLGDYSEAPILQYGEAADLVILFKRRNEEKNQASDAKD